LRIWAASYSLFPRRRLSAKAADGERLGSLLRIETPQGFGYADLHPWPELGDEPLERQLKLLQEGRPTDLARRSLALAQLDASARARGQSLFEKLEIPESHALLHDIDDSSIEEARARGFRVLKIKASEETDLKPFDLSGLRVRLDFNGRSGRALEHLPKEIQIDFIEDPAPWNFATWASLRLPLAFDRGDVEGIEDAAFEWLIVKPALHDPLRMLEHARRLGVGVVVTSYLDHPIGQMGAAFEAASLGPGIGVCGLASHLSYEPNGFSECIEMRGPHLLRPAGTGLGFDDLLAKQDWRPLK
jgi:O-succinylbenzoate synthase